MEKSSNDKPVSRIRHKRRAIPLERILERPGLNCRFSSSDAADLASSIERLGLLFPPLVAPAEDRAPLSEKQRFYYIVHGHRRVAAMRLLRWERSSFFVAEGMTLEDQYIVNLAENARENLTPAEVAERCCAILGGLSRSARPLTTEQLGERIGFSGSYLRNLMRLRRQLHPDLWAVMVRTGHSAPVGSLLNVVSKPLDQQLTAWKPFGEVYGARAPKGAQESKPVRGYSWRLRAAQLGAEFVEEVKANESPEFVRGARWLVDRLAAIKVES